jgi:hypothetical protein
VPTKDAPSLLISGSSPRCGSTWVQRIVHAATDIFIWGESFSLVKFLSYIHAECCDNDRVRSQETEDFYRSGQDPRTWVANINPPIDSLREGMRAFFARYYGTADRPRYGWKEVRYGRPELEFLWKLFPGVKVILLVRNPIDVIRSLRGKEWFGNLEVEGTLEMTCSGWARLTSDYLALRGRPEVFFVRYEDVRERLGELLEFVGGRDGDRLKMAVESVVGNAPSPPPLPKEDGRLVLKLCHREMRALGYLTPSNEPIVASEGGSDPDSPEILQEEIERTLQLQPWIVSLRAMVKERDGRIESLLSQLEICKGAQLEKLKAWGRTLSDVSGRLKGPQDVTSWGARRDRGRAGAAAQAGAGMAGPVEESASDPAAAVEREMAEPRRKAESICTTKPWRLLQVYWRLRAFLLGP